MSLTLNLDPAEFLDQAWQQQPRLIRQAFPNFADLIEPEILAGLALEEDVDSRVIIRHAEGWDVQHGPFESYDEFGQSGWTLLVQSVNEWLPEVQQLLAPFRFLPDWRLDDVMISFATENGDVGPHLDQYDVFIIQGLGRRHWQVGERLKNPKEFCPHPDLKQLSTPFEPIIDAILEPGDMLYIPAGCPHNGVGLEPSLNYSVGFRAPNMAELGAAVADMINHIETRPLPRFRDAHQSNYGPAHQVSAQQLTQLRNFLLSAWQQHDIDHALMLVLSQSKRPLPTPAAPIHYDEFMQQFTDPTVFIARVPGARMLLNPQQDRLYANGEDWEVTAELWPVAQWLGAMWEPAQLVQQAPLLQSAAAQQLCCDLINCGVLDLYQQHD